MYSLSDISTKTVYSLLGFVLENCILDSLLGSFIENYNSRFSGTRIQIEFYCCPDLLCSSYDAKPNPYNFASCPPAVHLKLHFHPSSKLLPKTSQRYMSYSLNSIKRVI